VLLAGAAFYASVVDRYYPIDHWLFFRYASIAAIALGWATACVCAGSALLARLFRPSLPLREHLVLAFASGVFLFQLAVFLVGLAGGLGTVSFFALPLAFVASGGAPLFRRLRRAFHHVRALTRRRVAYRPFRAIAWFAGIFAVGLLYFQILAPETIGFDARWYHMPLAEHYVANGAIRRTPEGWWLAAYPQLATYLFTWAFCLPHSALFDRVELSLHIELATLIGMLAAIPVAVRKLVRRTSAAGSFAAYFLFPQVFIYDSNLNGGSDHVSALFSLPLGLALLRAWPSLAPSACFVFAMMASGIILTKYSAYCVLYAPFFAFALRSLYLIARPSVASPPPASRSRLARGLIVALLGGLVLTAPHWLKNLVWYGDPFYPILRTIFTPRPWNAESPSVWRQFMGLMTPAPPGLRGVLDALRATVAFPFEVHDWWVFHHDVPIFGPLFVLFLPCLPFVRARKRLWAVYAAGLSAVFCWYLPCHYERYLRTAVPWMAAATAAMLVYIWRSGWLARAAMLPILLLTVVWSGDVYFWPTHNMVNDSPLHVASNLMASGFLGTRDRLRVNAPFSNYGETLPKGARVLLHETGLQLGLGVDTVSDDWQSGLSYVALTTPAKIDAELRRMGVTHVLYNRDFSNGRFSLGSDIAFYAYATRFTHSPDDRGALRLAHMPSSPPPAAFDDEVIYVACDGPYRRGVYGVADLNVPAGEAASPSPRRELPAQLTADDFTTAFVVQSSGCGDRLPAKAQSRYTLLFRRGRLEVFARR
jgi:hypothetical protein